MIRTSFRCAAAAALLAATASTQIGTPVARTGCPGSPAITTAGAPRLNHSVSFAATWPSATLSMMVIGYGTGNAIDMSAFLPFCTSPCGWYLAPFGVEYLTVAALGNRVVATLQIPGDHALLYQTYYVQALALLPLSGCFDMTAATPFSITF